MSKLFTCAIYALLLGLDFSLPLQAQASSEVSRCAELFNAKGISNNPTVKFEMVDVDVNGIKVTGDLIKKIRANLDLDDALLKYLKVNRLSVLSLGEGYSELLPFLIEKGVSIKGLDPWYHSANFIEEKSTVAEHMQQFQNLYAAYLIRGSALSIPLKPESVDFIFSHRLLNSLHIAEQLKVISESIRVLKVNGRAHLLLNETRITYPQNDLTFKTILTFIKENYPDQVSAQIVNGLLVVDKITKTSDPASIVFNSNNSYDNLPTGSRDRVDREDAALFAAYRATKNRLAKDPENINLVAELYVIEAKINSFRKAELTEQSPLRRWWNSLTSRFSVRPDIRE